MYIPPFLRIYYSLLLLLLFWSLLKRCRVKLRSHWWWSLLLLVLSLFIKLLSPTRPPSARVRTTYARARRTTDCANRYAAVRPSLFIKSKPFLIKLYAWLMCRSPPKPSPRTSHFSDRSRRGVLTVARCLTFVIITRRQRWRRRPRRAPGAAPVSARRFSKVLNCSRSDFENNTKFTTYRIASLCTHPRGFTTNPNIVYPPRHDIPLLVVTTYWTHTVAYIHVFDFIRVIK